MTQRVLPSLLAASVLVLCAGCLFPKNFGKTKKDPHVAASLEKEFRARWVEKRTGELTASGVNATAAQSQAEAEYSAKYSYAQPPPK